MKKGIIATAILAASILAPSIASAAGERWTPWMKTGYTSHSGVMKCVYQRYYVDNRGNRLKIQDRIYGTIFNCPNTL